VGDRILLTGHSHQAWPDVAFDAQMQAWKDAAESVDGKWELAAAIADEVREGYRRLLDDPDGHIALGQNTHELVTRFLSALPLRERPRVVTTDGEFHTVRRQLARLQEEGLEVVLAGATGSVPAPGAIAQAVIDALDDRTAAVVMSSVLYRNGLIVEGLGEVAKACEHVGATLLVDAYHSINVVPFSVSGMGLERAFVVGGGYKYCQFGEGVCFLRIPADCTLRPILTGWFSEFGELADKPTTDGRVAYGDGPLRFAGSTYDPVGHYRARAVLRFFQSERLNPSLLRAVSQAQLARLTEGIDALDLDPAVLSWNRHLPVKRRGGFLALDAPDAGELAARLRRRDVFCDHRGTVLRFGPAPYVTDAQLDEAVGLLGEAVGRP